MDEEQQNSISKEFETLRNNITQSSSELKSAIQTAKKEHLDDITKVINTESSSVKTSIEELRKDCRVINDVYTSLLKENSSLNKKVGELQSDNENLKVSVKEQKELIKEQQSQINDLHEKSLSNNNMKQRLEMELQSKASELQKKIVDCRELEKKVDELENAINVKNESLDELSNSKNTIQSELDKIKNDYQKLDIDDNLLIAFSEFSNLNDKTRTSLESIFPQSTFKGFISAGLRLNNIASLWEMTKRNIFNNSLEDIDKLNKIFEVLLLVYNDGSKEKQFELITPSIGSKYDSATCAIKEMKSSGKVSAVYLSGYKNVKDGSIHKAVISVTD